MALTVACVLSGGEYTCDHVRRLYELVEAQMTQSFRFVCITDSPFPGWWAKISLFEPGRFEGRVLYLDLDTTPVGPLDDLVVYPTNFGICRDFIGPGYNSSVMVWDSWVAHHLYRDFSMDQAKDYPIGDQQWITKKIRAPRFPMGWCRRYKWDIEHRGIDNDTRVVVYTGKPKPWDIGDPCFVGA